MYIFKFSWKCPLLFQKNIYLPKIQWAIICKWYSKAMSCHRIKDCCYRKWIASMHSTRCSLCVTEHTTEDKPSFFFCEKKMKRKKRINQLAKIHIFWCNKRKTVNLSLSKSHKKKTDGFYPYSCDTSRTWKVFSLLCIFLGLDWSFIFLPSALSSELQRVGLCSKDAWKVMPRFWLFLIFCFALTAEKENSLIWKFSLWVNPLAGRGEGVRGQSGEGRDVPGSTAILTGQICVWSFMCWKKKPSERTVFSALKLNARRF